jgi:hypothetical protein
MEQNFKILALVLKGLHETRYNMEFGHQLSIWSGTEEKHEKFQTRENQDTWSMKK